MVSSKINPNIQLMSTRKTELEKAQPEEEIYSKEKSKVTWLQERGRNTRFFHDKVKGRRLRNNINSLVDKNGTEHFEEVAKEEIAVKYFEELFHSSNPSAFEELFCGLEMKVTASINRELVKDVSAAEINQE